MQLRMFSVELEGGSMTRRMLCFQEARALFPQGLGGYGFERGMASTLPSSPLRVSISPKPFQGQVLQGFYPKPKKLGPCGRYLLTLGAPVGTLRAVFDDVSSAVACGQGLQWTGRC